MSLEIMLNAAGLAFIVAGARWANADGQVMLLMILTLAAAEVAVGLGLIIQMHKRFKTIDIDLLSRLRG
jgi:NADH-quinone oxidoreductase subunit K